MSTHHFGRIVRDKRERRGLTIAEAAELCGLSGRGLAQIELGDATPKLSTFIRIAAVLKIDLGDLECCKPSEERKDDESKIIKKD